MWLVYLWAGNTVPLICWSCQGAGAGQTPPPPSLLTVGRLTVSRASNLGQNITLCWPGAPRTNTNHMHWYRGPTRGINICWALIKRGISWRPGPFVSARCSASLLLWSHLTALYPSAVMSASGDGRVPFRTRTSVGPTWVFVLNDVNHVLVL